MKEFIGRLHLDHFKYLFKANRSSDIHSTSRDFVFLPIPTKLGDAGKLDVLYGHGLPFNGALRGACKKVVPND